MTNRGRIIYPSNAKPNMDEVFDTTFGNRANIIVRNGLRIYNIPGYGNNIAGSVPGDQGGVYASQKVDILNNDFSITYCISHSGETSGSDYGNTFAIFNDDTFIPQSSLTQSDSCLGIYRYFRNVVGKPKSLAPINSLAVEFDNFNYFYGGGSDEGGNADEIARNDNHTTVTNSEGVQVPIGKGLNGAHIAITVPEVSNRSDITKDNPLPHYAVSVVGNDPNGKTLFHDARWGTAKVEWVLLDAGATDSPTDNIYRFRYSYWYSPYGFTGYNDPHTYYNDPTGETVMGRTPDLSGYKDFTFSQMAQKFGYPESATTMPVTMAITSSTGSMANRSTWFKFPSKYDYKLNYFIKKPDGTLTTTPVPGITPNPLMGGSASGPLTLPAPPNVANYTFDQQSSDSRDQTIAASFNIEDNTFNYYYTENILSYTIEYYNNGVKMEPSATDTLPRTGTVLTTNPNVTSVPITNCPEGSAVASYEFPPGTKVGPPSATNPYVITSTNNVIKVNYKSSIIENPNTDQINDPDYLILNFDANDLNNGLANEEIRGRLTSKVNSSFSNQETIKYAILKGTPWSKVVEKAAVPKLELQSGNWLFNAPATGYNTDQWTTWRTVGTNIPAQDSTAKIDDLYQSGTRELTYYAQFTQNTPVGIKDKINSIIALVSASAILFLTYFYLIIRKKTVKTNL